MKSLSVCMMVQNAEKTLAIALESLNQIYDDLIIVDGGSTDKTIEIAETYGATIIHSPWPGVHSQQRNVYLQEVKTDWLFVLDSDEFIDQKTLDFLQSIRQNNTFLDKDSFWIPRKWISPFSLSQYITSSPHYPDWQCRLLRYSKELLYEGKVHEIIKGLKSYQICQDLGIYHLDLLINSEEKRKDKVRRYMKGDPRDGMMQFYLPDPNHLKLAEWSLDTIVVQARNLLDNLTIHNLHKKSHLVTPNQPDTSKYQNSELPIHFFTIVFNVEPYIQNYIDVFKNLPLKWHWHLIESCTNERLQDFDKLVQNYPDHVTVYRKQKGVAWDGKSEMLNELLISGIREKCLLWQVDVHELWTVEQISTVHQMFLKNPKKTAAFYCCRYSVEENRNINTGDCHTLNLEYSWLRTWKFRPGCVWLPNKNQTFSLSQALPSGEWRNVATANPFLRNETEKQGLIFECLHQNTKTLLNNQMSMYTNVSSDTTCKICNSASYLFDTALILNKHQVNYFQCSNCGFVQTEYPHWLHEAYSTPIAKSDVGLVSRNLSLSRLAENLILNYFDSNEKFLDYGCGYGLLVRMMRDLGFDFYGYDKYCQNLFYHGFVAKLQDPYELVTAFEVFEHLVDPLNVVEELVRFSRNILFSTQLLPQDNPRPSEWWYYALHEGQHISIYTHHTLSIIAEKFSLNLYSDGNSVHLLTEKKLPYNVLNLLYNSPLQKFRRPSLIEQDYQQAVTGIKPSQTNYKTSGGVEDSICEQQYLKIIVDGVFFQLYKTGIARVWRSLLEEWAKNGFSQNLIVLDRVGTAPKISGVFYRTIPAYDYNQTDADREMLQQVCDEEGADLFISTYYTTPISTPSVFMAYDMIPEVLGADFNEPMWREKHNGIRHASAYISISENTASDLMKCFSGISSEQVTVAHCGVSNTFSPATQADIQQFKIKYGITKPYFILVGAGSNYKNAGLFFKAFDQLYTKQGFEIVCTGGSSLWLSAEYRQFTSGCVVHPLQLSDEELSIAYSGATALVYPSLYEGFGMPVAEAMACGCPVITCPNSSLTEVGGEAVIYINENDIEALVEALCDVQKPKVRNSLIAAGLEQAKRFSWEKMADTVSSALINTTLLRLNLGEINLIVFPDWSQPEESLNVELGQVIKAVLTHPKSSQITLLIDNSNISGEEADLVLSSIIMNLMMEEELEISEEPNLALIGELSEVQWSAIIPRLKGRISLTCENQEAIKQTKAENLLVIDLENLE